MCNKQQHPVINGPNKTAPTLNKDKNQLGNSTTFDVVDLVIFPSASLIIVSVFFVVVPSEVLDVSPGRKEGLLGDVGAGVVVGVVGIVGEGVVVGVVGVVGAGVVVTGEGVVVTGEGVVVTGEGVVVTGEGVVVTGEGVVVTGEGVVVVPSGEKPPKGSLE